MFSVGLNSHIKDLIAVKNVAIPGAISQIVITTITSMFLAHFFGWDYKAGLVFGISISVASTVVLMRVLSDNKVLHTKILEIPKRQNKFSTIFLICPNKKASKT